MLDDVAAYLVLGPVASTLALVTLVALWLLGGRGLTLRPRRARQVSQVETEVAVRRRT